MEIIAEQNRIYKTFDRYSYEPGLQLCWELHLMYNESVGKKGLPHNNNTHKLYSPTSESQRTINQSSIKLTVVVTTVVDSTPSHMWYPLPYLQSSQSIYDYNLILT